ncbi:MAG: RNA polymerase sigma factor [Acidimicrobiales bacterium]
MDALDFDEYFEAAKHQLLAHAYVLTGDVPTAEDLVQETFLRTWRHWGRVSRLDDPGAWSRKVLDNLAVDTWRRRSAAKRQVRRGRDLTAQPAIDADHLDVAAALRQLPAHQRQALVLFAIVGRSTAEVATEMGTTEATVRSWLSRARATVADKLSVEGTDLGANVPGPLDREAP